MLKNSKFMLKIQKPGTSKKLTLEIQICELKNQTPKEESLLGQDTIVIIPVPKQKQDTGLVRSGNGGIMNGGNN